MVCGWVELVKRVSGWVGVGGAGTVGGLVSDGVAVCSALVQGVLAAMKAYPKDSSIQIAGR